MTADSDQVALWKNVLAKIKETSEKRKEISAKINAELEGCTKVMGEVRDRALCLRCSGSADKFYNDTNKSYKVKKEFCFGFINKCKNVFAYTTMAQSFFAIQANVKTALKGSVSSDEKKATAAIATEAKIDAWIACAENPSSC